MAKPRVSATDVESWTSGGLSWCEQNFWRSIWSCVLIADLKYRVMLAETLLRLVCVDPVVSPLLVSPTRTHIHMHHRHKRLHHHHRHHHLKMLCWLKEARISDNCKQTLQRDNHHFSHVLKRIKTVACCDNRHFLPLLKKRRKNWNVVTTVIFSQVSKKIKLKHVVMTVVFSQVLKKIKSGTSYN